LRKCRLNSRRFIFVTNRPCERRQFACGKHCAHTFGMTFPVFAKFFFSSRRRHTRSVSAFLLNRSSDLLSAADLPPSPTKSSNLSETAEVPACNVPSRSPLPALAIAPETKLGTASSGLGTLEP